MKNLMRLTFIALLSITTTVTFAQPTPKVTGDETQTTTVDDNNNINSQPTCKVKQGKRVRNKKQTANRVTNVNARRGKKCNNSGAKAASKAPKARRQAKKVARRTKANS